VRQTIPGWPYSMLVALEPGRSSWTALLDAVGLPPAGHATEVTAGQIRGLVGRLAGATRHRPTPSPGEAPLDPERLTPARVRRGFPCVRRTAGDPASAPKPTRPGPGRPKGSRNRHKAPHYTVGKQPKVDTRQSATARHRG
jgi:hypothetical protein